MPKIDKRIVRVDLDAVRYTLPHYRSNGLFAVEYTPKQMLKAGVFGGAYFGAQPFKHDNFGLFTEFKLFSDIVCVDEPDAANNKYGLLSGKSLDWWLDRSLISNLDPLGWFQWYCNYYYGRRHRAEDTRQIKRWSAFRRHKAQVLQNPHQPRLRQKQALLQWAYKPT